MGKNKPSLRGDLSLKQSKQNQKINPTLDIFYKIAEIPHPSSHTKDLQKFLVDFLKRCDCKVETDSAGNIHALKGAPTLIFQAHYDMVLVGEKITPFVEGGFLKSRDSSLGADNGIAVALLLDFAQKCKNFEILLTNDEEIGMLGANNLKLKTHSKTMINLDSECINEICVGCAGGFDADIDLTNFSLAEFGEDLGAECLQGAEIYELSAQYFKGGHSGIDIDKNIKNAIVELLWRLESLREKCEFRILEISGGEKRNSIPINAKAVIAVKNSSLGASFALGENFGNQQTPSLVLSQNFLQDTKSPPQILELDSNKSDSNDSSDSKDSPSLAEGARGWVNSPQITIKKLTNYTTTQKPLNSAVIPHLLRLHNGIYEKSNEGIISSLNFSLLSNESLKIMIRANSAELLHRHEMRLKSLFGDSVKISGFYNAWEDFGNSSLTQSSRELEKSSFDRPQVLSHSDFSSQPTNLAQDTRIANDSNYPPLQNLSLLETIKQIYKKHKIAHKIVQIHAGLECGILKEKCALSEVISIGPTIFHPHSKNEALDLESVEQIYDILCDLMELSK